MKIRSTQGFLLAAALVLTVPTISGFAQNDSGAKQSMKSAGTETKDAAKDTGRGIKQGTKKAYHKTKRGTKKVAHKVEGKNADGTPRQ